MTNDHYSNIVERYLDGGMSQNEVLNFEEMLHQDPLLGSELAHQQQTINGLKDYRIAELKTRLNNIDVTPGLIQTVASNSMVQMASGVLVTGSLLVGGYLWMASAEKEAIVDFNLQSRSIDVPEREFMFDPELRIPTIEIKGIPAKVPSPGPFGEIELAIAGESDASEDLAFIPNIVVPNLSESLESEDNDLNVDAPNANIPFSNKEQKNIDIENVKDGRYDFHYKFYNNKLFLYGDFRGIPYEIFEINGKTGKRLFLLHEEVYYRIFDSVTQVSQLQRVVNADLIEELTILKENKSQ